MTWKLTMDAANVHDHDPDIPLFARIARAIAAEIARGRLRPGQRLPGTRSLAQSLGVNRNTINAAMDELVSQGWIETRPARGCFVRTQAPGQDRPRPLRRDLAPRSDVPRRPSFALPRAARPAPFVDGRASLAALNAAEAVTSRPARKREPLFLTGGLPDPRLFPGVLLSRAYRRALGRSASELLDYGDARGHARLRRALADMLAATRGLATTADDVIVTRGSQMAIWLVGRVLIEPGDRVAVESYGYPPAWEALQSHGAELLPVPVDEHGMRVDRLQALAQERPLRAVYVTPHHQFPTMAVLSARRRLELLDLARKHRFAVIEDDYDNEFHYEGRPILPLASTDRGGSVVYVGTLSKVLAPGLRIGYVVAPQPLIERMAVARRFIDRQGDSAMEAAVAELMEDGELQRHIWRTRRTYQARRDALVAGLRAGLGHVLDFEVPRGGMALWARVAEHVDADQWAERARERGVIVTPGRALAFDHGREPHLRLGFARVDEAEIAQAVAVLAATAHALGR